MANVIQQFLDSGGDRKAMGDLDELRDAMERVTAYQSFLPNRFDRREANHRLHALWQNRRLQP
jgi:hypothetical protein